MRQQLIHDLSLSHISYFLLLLALTCGREVMLRHHTVSLNRDLNLMFIDYRLTLLLYNANSGHILKLRLKVIHIQP